MLDIYLKYSTSGCVGDKGTLHSYLQNVYSRLFAAHREAPISILEIGVGHGHSLKLWEEYFQNAELVVGVDIAIKDIRFEFTKAILMECDASNSDALNENFAKNSLGEATFDFIIDDGSHITSDQLASFEYLINRLRPNGIYLIEDVTEPEVLSEYFNDKRHPFFIYNGIRFRERFDDLLFGIFKK